MVGAMNQQEPVPSWRQIFHESEMRIHNEYKDCEYLGYRLELKNRSSLIGSNGARPVKVHSYTCNGLRKEATHDHNKYVANKPVY